MARKAKVTGQVLSLPVVRDGVKTACGNRIGIIQVEQITIQRATKTTKRDRQERNRKTCGKKEKENNRGMCSRLLRFNPVHAVVYTLAMLPVLQVHLVVRQGFSGTRGIQLSQFHQLRKVEHHYRIVPCQGNLRI
jgi:hypothetical protein